MGNGVIGNIVAFDQMGNGATTFGQDSTSIRTIELPLISHISFIKL